MKVSTIAGPEGMKALTAFNALLFAYKGLPAYVHVPYVEFFESFKHKTDSEKETILREALSFYSLEHDEIRAIVSFGHDKNGIAYGETNVKNLSVEELFEIIIAVCMEIGKIHIDIVSEEEKKKLKISPSIFEASI